MMMKLLLEIVAAERVKVIPGREALGISPEVWS